MSTATFFTKLHGKVPTQILKICAHLLRCLMLEIVLKPKYEIDIIVGS
jgi:hypothetical protein